MLKFFIVIKLTCLSIIAGGCSMIISGDQLTDLDPLIPKHTPVIEYAIGDFVYEFDSSGLKTSYTSNKAGKKLTDHIMRDWKDKKYISDFSSVERIPVYDDDFSYTKGGDFTGKAEYNLTLEGKEYDKQNTPHEIISKNTFFIIPYTSYTYYNLIFKLENTKTGTQYIAQVSDYIKRINSILLLPFFLFSGLGYQNTLERLSEHAYQDFVKQGAFLNEYYK